MNTTHTLSKHHTCSKSPATVPKRVLWYSAVREASLMVMRHLRKARIPPSVSASVLCDFRVLRFWFRKICKISFCSILSHKFDTTKTLISVDGPHLIASLRGLGGGGHDIVLIKVAVPAEAARLENQVTFLSAHLKCKLCACWAFFAESETQATYRDLKLLQWRWCNNKVQ